jgi:peptide/nickel transport system substrate-binding protein
MRSATNRVGALLSAGALLGAGTLLVTAPAGTASAASSSVSIAVDNDPAPFTYDPLSLAGGGVVTFWQGLYNSLFTTTSTGAVVPQLATGYKFNSTKTKLTIKLRSGVKFSDGSTLNAALVEANLSRRSQPMLGAYGAFAPGGAAAIKSVTAANPTTVVITFAQPTASAPSLLAENAGWIVGMNAIKNPAVLTMGPDGSGAYSLNTGASVKGSSYVLTKKPSSWDAKAFPWSTVTFNVIADPQARANAVVSGQDQLAEIDPLTATFVKHQTGETRFPGEVYGFAVFDKDGTVSKPFSSVTVRQALSMAINRTALAAIHTGANATASLFPSGTKGYDAALDKKYAYNPAAAKQLLAQAGYPNGFSFTLVTVGLASSTDLQAVQANWQSIGVNMTISPATSFAEGLQAQSTTPLGYNPFVIGQDPLGFVTGFLLGGTLNLQHATDPKIGSALAVAEAGSGNNDTKALVKLNDAIVNEGWFIPTYAQSIYYGYNSKTLRAPELPADSIYPTLSSIRPAG